MTVPENIAASASQPPPPRPLHHWLEKVGELDVRNLQSEWTRITSIALCRELAWMLAQESSDPLEALLNRLAEERMRKLFLQFFKPTLEERRRLSPEQIARNSISGEAVYNRLCGMVASALAVRAALEPTGRNLSHWIGVTLCAWSGLPLPATAAPALSLKSENPEVRLDSALIAWRQAHPALALSEVGAARTWLHALCNAVTPTPASLTASTESMPYRAISSRETWLLNYRNDGKAFLGRLCVEALPEGDGSLYAHPERIGLLSMSAEFRETVRTAWELAQKAARGDSLLLTTLQQHDFRWWLEGFTTPSEGDAALLGGSHGAAAAVAFTQLLADDPIDPEFVVTGEIDALGHIQAVGFVKEKAEEALTRRDERNMPLITRLCVPDANYPQACEGAALIGRAPTSCVLTVKTLTDVLLYASGLPEQMRRLCTQERDTILYLASQRMQRPLNRWEDYHEIYVPLQVEITRPVVDSVDSSDEPLAAQTLTLPWQEARKTLLRALITADSGLGKTALFWYEVGERCTTALEHLTQTNDLSAKAHFAFALSPKTLPLSQSIEGAADLMALFVNSILSRIEIRASLYPHVQRQLTRMIIEGNCVLYLDALDEAKTEAQLYLQNSLQEFVRSYPNARLFLSLRPVALLLNKQVQQEWDQVSLLPFRTEQIRQSVFAWFHTNPDNAANLWRRIEKNPRHLQILQNPLLLWIACTLAPSERTAGGMNWRRRADLLELFIDDAIAKWAQRPPIPSIFQQSAFRTLLGELSFGLLQRRQGDFWTQETVQHHIQASMRSYPALKGRDLLQDLLHIGILTLLSSQRQEQGMTFSHLAIGDYLAGVYLARKINVGKWHEEKEVINMLAGEPAWQEPMVFASVYIDNPAPLLDLLCNPGFDDETRRRLTLAAYCLAEISSGL